MKVKPFKNDDHVFCDECDRHNAKVMYEVGGDKNFERDFCTMIVCKPCLKKMPKKIEALLKELNDDS